MTATSYRRSVTVPCDELADGCYVTFRNPQLQNLSESASGPELELDEEGKPKDRAAALAATKQMFTDLITDWHVFDVTVEDQDVLLPLPSVDATALDRCPIYLLNKMGMEVQKLRNPQ